MPPSSSSSPQRTGHALSGLNDDAAEHLRAALGQVGDDSEEAARLKALLASVLVDVGLWDDAAGLAREATETFDGLGDDSAAGSAAATWGTALGQSGDITGGRAVVLPRWERLRDDPSATRAALALSRALVYTCHTGQVDEVARESLAVRARLAEKVDDPGELADTFLWTGIDHLFTGATTLGLTLIDATARIARENQLTQPLTRALINLTANAITEDAGEAVVSGREAVMASRRGGTASQRSTAQLNLALALWVRGSWGEMATLVGSVRPGIGAVPFEEYVFIGADYLLAGATGRATIREDVGVSATARTSTPPTARGCTGTMPSDSRGRAARTPPCPRPSWPWMGTEPCTTTNSTSGRRRSSSRRRWVTAPSRSGSSPSSTR